MQVGRKVPAIIDQPILDTATLGLLAILYAPIILHWCEGWIKKDISIEHEYFSHGLIGLPFAAYICWTNRTYWRRLPSHPHPLGAVLLLLGGGLYLIGLPDFVNPSFPLVLIGLCLWLKGPAGLRLQAFPLLLVALATPTEIPYLIAPFTLPLQHFIAATAGFILNQFALNVRVEGISLFVNDQIVEVAPYCAGLKMLFTTLYVGLMLLYWRDDISSRSRTISLLTGGAVLSVTANVIRNTLLTFFHGTGRESAFEWLHEGWGGDVYSACMLGLLIPLLIGIEKLFPEKSVPVADEVPALSQDAIDD